MPGHLVKSGRSVVVTGEGRGFGREIALGSRLWGTSYSAPPWPHKRLKICVAHPLGALVWRCATCKIAMS